MISSLFLKAGASEYLSTKNHVTNKDRLIGTIVTLKNYGRTYYLAPNQEQFYDVRSTTEMYTVVFTQPKASTVLVTDLITS